MQIRIKIFILFCLLATPASILRAKAAVDNSRLQDLLEKAKARKEEKITPSTSVKEESGYLPASNIKTKEVVHEETYTQKTIEVNKTVPKTPVQNNVNELFNQTRTNIQNHKQESVKPVVKPVVKPYQAPVTKVAPKTITKTTAKPPVVVPAKPTAPPAKPVVPATKPVVPAKPAPQATKPTVPAKPTPAKAPVTVKKDIPAVKVESKTNVTQAANKTQAVTNSKIEVEDHPEEDALEEDEFMQDPNEGLKSEEDEEAELDKDEGLKVIEKKIDLPPRKPIDKATREKEYLDLIKKSLKSLEEDSWNEVKFNMNEALEYFNREKDFYAPEEIDKFYRITLAFLRFSEGGLELDQGDFADFEDAEAHYLDAQDIVDEVELKLNANIPIDKELLNIIQTVKKYINEDIEYIEEMIDLS